MSPRSGFGEGTVAPGVNGEVHRVSGWSSVKSPLDPERLGVARSINSLSDEGAIPASHPGLRWTSTITGSVARRNGASWWKVGSR